MGILVDALSIIVGSLLGCRLQNKMKSKDHTILAIAILMVSLVGFLENIYNMQGERNDSTNLLVVLFSFILGSKIGDYLRIDERLSDLSKTPSKNLNAFIDSTLFFGVGGLQISGPILLALHNDSSQLFLKGFVDFPFSVAFGATFGTITSLSALPVAAIQVVVAVIAYLFSGFLSDDAIAQLCAMGYVILFFSGYNLMTHVKHKINNINMLPGIFLIVLFNLIMNIVERI